MKKIISLCVAALMTASFATQLSASTPEPLTSYTRGQVQYSDEADTPSVTLPEFPEISSQKIVVMDADSGEVLYQQNGDTRCYPASTTKLLTALITIENCAMDETVTYSEAAVKSIKSGDANATISIGEQMTVEQSLYCLLLRSANDAAYGLAEHTAGSISDFASLMNAKAAQLGCNDTHFANASGLHDDFHYSTPYDMALIARECMQNKMLMSILGYSKVYMIAPTNTSSFTRYYTHRYAMVGSGAYAYPYSLGGKTGYTTDASYCLISFAQKDDLRLIVVIMESTDAGRYLDTIALFDYYFNNFHKEYLSDINTGFSHSDSSVLSLTQEITSTHQVNVGFAEDAYLLVPNGYTSEDLTGIISYAGSMAYTGKENGFACISYFINSFNVGNATLYITDYAGDDEYGFSGVPKRNHRIEQVTKELTYINIWYILAGFLGFCILVAIIVLIIYRYLHSRGRNQKRKLSF